MFLPTPLMFYPLFNPILFLVWCLPLIRVALIFTIIKMKIFLINLLNQKFKPWSYQTLGRQICGLLKNFLTQQSLKNWPICFYSNSKTKSLIKNLWTKYVFVKVILLSRAQRGMISRWWYKTLSSENYSNTKHILKRFGIHLVILYYNLTKSGCLIHSGYGMNLFLISIIQPWWLSC